LVQFFPIIIWAEGIRNFVLRKWKLKQEGTYKNDKSEGIYKYYYENRKLVNAGTHKDGNLKMNL